MMTNMNNSVSVEVGLNFIQIAGNFLGFKLPIEIDAVQEEIALFLD